MDEKGSALEATSTVKGITNVENKAVFLTTTGNPIILTVENEAVFRTTIENRECILMAVCEGEIGPLYVKFKGQQIKPQPGQIY